ncbi:phosphate regulon sensor histidine kinase PhoR [Limnohabitans sp. B9-3]|uniref:phosphate regulon sensor histidine kinase PhoR n=1 Tax=Limnohabitans sp. B9-3 TaxID=1100707 RepID=UPI000CC46C49|nr:phosphate regulon sensor histidine kinase PhoR [Limnohabitans sp. B9-3]PIT77615.1 phosphate regulon sensor histidine kinase PhoR [Limnohabitans sp. B9-3]
MLWRIFSMLGVLMVGAAAGAFWGIYHGRQAVWTWLLLGALLGGTLWWVIDASRGLRVLAWLRSGELNQAPTIFGLWGDVVDRARSLLRQKERAIAASDQRLKDFLSAIQASPNGVLLLDAQNQIEWCNQTAAQQLGIDVQRDQRQRIGNLMRDPVFTAYMAAKDPSESVVIEGRGHRMDRPVRLSLQRHPYGEGKQMLLTRDVTLLEQAEAMRRDFVANVSHEIRTPLTVMSGFVETLQTLSLPLEDQQRYLGLMATQAHRMQTLVEDLLTLSRLEGSPNPGLHTQLPLTQLMQACEQEALGLSATMAHGQGIQTIEFSTACELSDAVLMGEPRELQSALSNLVSNAVRYTPADGMIQVHAGVKTDGSLQLSVKDSGAGIAAEHVPRLTERFYRVDRSRSRESGGTGLGLAIVKHVMQRHGGSLLITSVLGQGSTFTLVLPSSRWRLNPSTPAQH